MKTFGKIAIIAALAMMPLLFSCEFVNTSTDENDIKIVVLCTGINCINTSTSSTTTMESTFTVSYLFDNALPMNQGTIAPNIVYQPNNPLDLTQGGSCFSVYPAGNISKATITITKNNDDTALMVMIYNNGEADKNGFGNLAACSTGSSSSSTCTNTLTIQYEVKSTDDTDSKTATSSTSSTSSSSN
jgi:hypothetical protein